LHKKSSRRIKFIDMKPKLKFVENEGDKNELYGEFYLEKNNLTNITAVILIDSQTKDIKETHTLEETFDSEGNFIDSTPIKYECNFDRLADDLIENEKGEDLTRNYYHY